MFTFKSNRLLTEKNVYLDLGIFSLKLIKRTKKKDAFPIIREFNLIIDHLDYP